MSSNRDLQKLQRRLAAVPKEIRKAVRPIVDKSADDMVTMARRFAPRADGVLEASIKNEPGAHELERLVVAGGETTTVAYTGRGNYRREVTIGQGSNRGISKGGNAGVSYDYALAQEYGTQDHPPQPFFWPAYRLMRKTIRSRIRRAVGKAVKDFNNGN